VKLTPGLWAFVIKAVESAEASPPWVKAQAKMSWETVSQMPSPDLAKDGQLAVPVVEQRAVTPDYLNLLRDQIKQNARGPEWLALLKKRLAALESNVGKELMDAAFHCRPRWARLRIRPETGEVILVEVM
jgi:hypothetical protein